MTDISNPRRGKKSMIAGSLLAAIGFMMVFLSSQSTPNGVVYLGAMLGIGGLVTLYVGRFTHWYNWK